jgi:hypothetical protein
MMTNLILPSPALIANALTIILCLAVLIQSARMMRNLKAVNISQMGTVVLGLDHATGQARKVLGDLKVALIEEGAQNAAVVAQGEALRDELRMLIEIADNMASRLADAPKLQVVAAPAPAPAAEPVAAAVEAPLAAAPEVNGPDRDLASLRALVADYGRTRISIDRAIHRTVHDIPADDDALPSDDMADMGDADVRAAA